MAGVVAPIALIPPPTIPVVDPKTGQMSRAWYEYLRAADAKQRELEARIAALEP